MKITYTFFTSGISKMRTYKFVFSLLVVIAITTASANSLLVSGIYKKEKEPETVSYSLVRKSLKIYLISGKVTQTFPYCGGARPTKEILERLATPAVFANKKFYIRRGKINSTTAKIIKSFITDSSGGFSIQLQPGTYSIILEEQLYKIKEEHYKKPNQRVDIKCLTKWWAKPYYLLKVENNNIADLKFNFQRRCFIDSDIPCIYYTGQLRH